MCMVKQIGYIILAYQLTKLPELQKRGSTRADDATVRTRDAHAKARMKRYADDRAHATQRNIEKGEVVLVQQKKVNKLSTPYAPTPLDVSETKGTMITARRPDGSSITRNSSKFRRIRGMRANDIEHLRRTSRRLMTTMTTSTSARLGSSQQLDLQSSQQLDLQ